MQFENGFKLALSIISLNELTSIIENLIDSIKIIQNDYEGMLHYFVLL